MKIVEARNTEAGVGHYKNGKAGDQTGKEVLVCNWRSFGYRYVFRFKDKSKAEKFVKILKYWANSSYCGYDQNNRNSLYDYCRQNNFTDYKLTKNVECVCSTFVITALRFVGIKIPRGTLSGNMIPLLTINSGFKKLTNSQYLISSDYLEKGDILIKSGHVAVAAEDGTKVKEGKGK